MNDMHRIVSILFIVKQWDSIVNDVFLNPERISVNCLYAKNNVLVISKTLHFYNNCGEIFHAISSFLQISLNPSTELKLTNVLLFKYRNVIHAKPSKNCTTLRNTFSNSHQNFVNCAITNSEPIKYCRHCGNGFSALAIHYNNLLANDECKALWFNRDRLNILELVYSSAQSLWTAGSCSSTLAT